MDATMVNELLALRRYLDEVLAQTEGFVDGRRNVTGWFKRWDLEELIPRPTFQNLYTKDSTPSIETIIRATMAINKARAHCLLPPISPMSVAVLVPSLVPIVEALTGTGQFEKHEAADLPEAELQAAAVVSGFESLPLENRVAITPRILELCAEAISMQELHGIKKLQWIFCEIQKRRSKGWPDFHNYYWPNNELSYKTMELIADGKIPPQPLTVRELGAIEGFLSEVEGRTLLKFDAEDLDCLKRSRKKT